MKKIIQIFANWSANQVEILRQYGIVTEEGCNSIFIEEEKLSENVYSLLKEWRVVLILFPPFARARRRSQGAASIIHQNRWKVKK